MDMPASGARWWEARDNAKDGQDTGDALDDERTVRIARCTWVGPYFDDSVW